MMERNDQTPNYGNVAEILDLAGLFQRPISYRIPQFQRAYAWKESTQWEPLWGLALHYGASRQAWGLERSAPLYGRHRSATASQRRRKHPDEPGAAVAGRGRGQRRHVLPARRPAARLALVRRLPCLAGRRGAPVRSTCARRRVVLRFLGVRRYDFRRLKRRNRRKRLT